MMDTSLLDKAIIFATKAHAGVERRGQGFPYIIHPLEVMTIVSTLTNDQIILATAVLHDVIEDTDCTFEDIEREFGKKVCELLRYETDLVVANKSASESWKERKAFAIKRLADAPLEAKMVAMGDKLSNMRLIARDYRKMGDKLWLKFHVNDRKDHEWHYRGLAASLIELKDTEPYKEFIALIDEIFGGSKYEN